MLRANVGLSRKVSRDYQSTGYTVNLDGEIAASPDDAEAVLERVRELFDLAHEALNAEIDRDQGEQAIARRDEEPPAQDSGGNDAPANGRADRPAKAPAPRRGPPPDSGKEAASDDAATNKQVQFLLTMSKRFKLSSQHFEARIAEIVGRRCGVYDLTKKEAGLVLDNFTNGGNGNQDRQSS